MAGIPTPAVLRRMLWAVVAPRQAVAQISDHETVSWFQAVRVIALFNLFDLIFHPYLMFRQLIFGIRPDDWSPMEWDESVLPSTSGCFAC